MVYLVCIERALYWFIWVGATVYALFQFAKICQSENHLYRLNQQDFKDGSLSDNHYDASDFEWQSFKKLYTNYWYIILVHFTLSNVFTVYNQPALKLASWIFTTLYAIQTVFSVGALVVVLINVMMLILLAILGRNILSYTLCLGVVLAVQSTEISRRLFNANDPRMTNEFDYEEKQHLFTYALCFLNARGLSSSLDNLTAKHKKEIQSGKDQFYEKVITITAYLLYLPGFFSGPIYMYEDFEKATRLVKAEPDKENFLGSNYFNSMSRLLILILNIIYYEWLLHWLYSSAVVDELSVLSLYNAWQFSGLIVSLCLLIYMKYTCIYGAFKVLATFDGVASVAPPLPKCPAAMHLSSQLWRGFDVGLYRWLRRYFYDPIVSREGAALESRSTLRRYLGVCACFMVMTLWHLPITASHITWIVLNTLNTFIELWARALSRIEVFSRFKSKLSRASNLRILAVLGTPLFLLTIVSNLNFLASNELVSHELVKRVLSTSSAYPVYLLLALYCGANVSLDYNRVVKSSVDFAACHGFASLRRTDCPVPAKQSSSSKKSK